MEFLIARHGKTYGPYSEAEVRAHLASGHVVPSDLTRSSAMQEWLPVSQLFATTPHIARRTFPNPPNLPWWLALLLNIVTCTIFFVIWDLVEAAWMHRVRPQSRALLYYSAATVLFIINMPASYHSLMHSVFDGPAYDAPYATALAILGFGVRLVARFSLRRSLLAHFNSTEPIGLRLNWIMTLFFGGLYFQYHFNRINQTKRALESLSA